MQDGSGFRNHLVSRINTTRLNVVHKLDQDLRNALLGFWKTISILALIEFILFHLLDDGLNKFALFNYSVFRFHGLPSCIFSKTVYLGMYWLNIFIPEPRK